MLGFFQLLPVRAFFAAAVLALGFPPYNLWPLVFVSWFIFLMPLCDGDFFRNFPRPRKFILYGVQFVFWIYTLGFFWLSYTLKEFGNIPWLASVPLTGLIFLAHTGFWAGLLFLLYFLFARFSHYMNFLRGPHPLRLLCVFWILIVWEQLDWRLFPWTSVQGLGSQKQLLASVYFLKTWGWQILFFGSLLLGFGLSKKVQSSLYKKLVVVGVSLVMSLSVGLSLGFRALAEMEETYVGRQPVVLVQGNIGNYEKKLAKSGLAPTVRNVLAVHTELLRGIEEEFSKSPPPLEPWVFWPETSYPLFPVSQPIDAVYIKEWGARLGAPQWVGTYHTRPTNFGGEVGKVLDFNVVAMFHPRVGLVGHYEKSIRVVFGEYIPGDEFWPGVYDAFPAAVHFGRADAPKALPHPDPEGPVFLPLICYEILYPGFVKKFLEAAKKEYPGREFILVNATNDSWYGSGTEPFQHSLLARWTVASLGLPTVRPTNTGLSQVIAPWGEVLQAGPQNLSTVIYGNLPVQRPQKRDF